MTTTTTTKKLEDYTWDDLVTMEAGTILHDEFREGIRFIIMRGPAALCAYVGVPLDHPLAGLDYGDLALECHGGLTFSGAGDGKYHPSGYWWYGWDYAHSQDATIYDYTPDGLRFRKEHPKFESLRAGCKQWLPFAVLQDSEWTAIYGFQKLVALVEKIVRRGVSVRVVKAKRK